MRWSVVAVGDKLPAWADDAVEDYRRRLPPEFALPLRTVKPEARTGGRTAAQCMAAEAQRLAAAIAPQAQRIVLDERGQPWTTVQLADRVRRWHDDAVEVAWIVGGADGLDPALKADAAATVRLSSLTLPHALARVVLVEALYRAWTVIAGHPYHRA